MDNKILLQDLAMGVSARTSSAKKDADNFVRNVFDIIVQYLQEDKIVKIKGLGTFKVIEVSGRDSVNVNTGERIHISGHSKISFSPDTALRDQVNRPFADFETIIINDGIDIEEMERIPEIVEDVPEPSDAEVLNAEPSSDDITKSQENEAREMNADVNAADAVPQEGRILESAKLVEIQEDVDSQEEVSVVSVEDSLVQEVHDEEVKADQGLDETDDTSDSQPNDTSIEVKESSEDTDVVRLHDTISTDDKEERVKIVEKEKVVYVERKPCKLCWVLYILLMLAMMALSYLAGSQGWFSKGDNEDIPDTEIAGAEVQTPSDVDLQDRATQQSDDSISTAPEEVLSAEEAAITATANLNVEDPKPQDTYPDGVYEITGTKCVHLLKAGEGLYQLARIYYKNMNMAEYIVKYNHITNPDIVSEGTAVKIPELKHVR